ncbi:MAG: pyridoxal-phosphate dependent enzyme [Candidatus Altiarchaeota archaeon]
MAPAKDDTTTNLGSVTHLECLNCGEKYSLEKLKNDQGTTMVNICYDSCFGPLDIKYDYEKLKNELTADDMEKRGETFWRIRELQPVNEIHIEDRPYTPLVESRVIGDELGIRLFFKLDCNENNPTRSFKDRPVTLAFNKALEAGYDTVYVASTGNLAVASAYAAKQTGIKPRIYVPETLGKVKKNAIRKYLPENEELVELPFPYDETNIRAMEDCRAENERFLEKEGRTHAFVPNNSFRPYYKEGSKTSGTETAYQIRKHAEEGETINLVYPLGSGALFCSAYKGINELMLLGLTENPARMWGAQGEKCAPIIDAIPTGNILPVKNPQTIAKSIAIGNPGSGYQTLDVMKESQGGGWRVTEEEIIENTLDLYLKEGVFSQFVGGVTLAGVRHGVERGDLKKGEVVVANITGTGFQRIEDDLVDCAKQYGLEDKARQVISEVS